MEELILWAQGMAFVLTMRLWTCGSCSAFVEQQRPHKANRSTRKITLPSSPCNSEVILRSFMSKCVNMYQMDKGLPALQLSVSPAPEVKSMSVASNSLKAKAFYCSEPWGKPLDLMHERPEQAIVCVTAVSHISCYHISHHPHSQCVI